VSGIVDDIPASRAGPVIADIVDNDGSRHMVWWSASAFGSSPVTARWLPRSPRDDHRLPLAAIGHHRGPNRMIVFASGVVARAGANYSGAASAVRLACDRYRVVGVAMSGVSAFWSSTPTEGACDGNV
jgi:hypothetical protein